MRPGLSGDPSCGAHHASHEIWGGEIRVPNEKLQQHFSIIGLQKYLLRTKKKFT
jgi:hypothetical protein